ncbi:MAG: AAA family ATPase [Burkholderiales bacterium]|nr:AAA family ATPase [Burkholderiales bacterium]
MSEPGPTQVHPQALDYIAIGGFKSLANVRVRLASINVLIGANGSGKSNFIESFAFLHAIREGRLQDYVRRAGGAENLLHFGSRVTKEIWIHVSFLDETNQYRLVLKPTADDSLFASSEIVSFWDKRYARPYDQALRPAQDGREAGISAPNLIRTPGWVRARLARWRVYHVHDTSSTSLLRKTSQVADNNFLRPDGENLPAFLLLLKNKHPDAYSAIRSCVQQVAPYFQDFLLTPDPSNIDTIRLAWVHKDSDRYFGAAALSDGTLRFILLATLFLQPLPMRPSVIIVDEPELGLHPAAIAQLAALTKQAAVSTQVILATQSPLLLDYYAPEQVLVANRVKGATELSRLNSAHLQEWLDDYSLGQLWEKNELGGRPS